MNEQSKKTTGAVGIVVIGRNEGERLKRCLPSAIRCRLPLVYVDSGSVDLSVPFARECGVGVVELDDSLPYTAARARNVGFEVLLTRYPKLEFVQFMDGDCELCDGWLERAVRLMGARPDVAVVCGRVREQHPQASVYNRICEMEWKKPIGEIEGCGGNMLIRVSAFRQVEGFRPEVIAAEDTELCTRLHLSGWKVFSIDADMVRHDAAMLRFAQWWRRAVRAGHAMTEGAARHGRSPARLFVKASRRICIYGFILPLLALLLLWPSHGWSLCILAVYALQYVKTYAGLRKRGETPADAGIYAGHCVLAKFPQAIGQLVYCWNRLAGRRSLIIEHKRPSATPAISSGQARSRTTAAKA